jgi:hypothetical protein
MEAHLDDETSEIDPAGAGAAFRRTDVGMLVGRIDVSRQAVVPGGALPAGNRDSLTPIALTVVTAAGAAPVITQPTGEMLP